MKRENIIEQLENMDNASVVDLHNRVCENTQHMDNHIFQMGEIDEQIGYGTFTELYDRVCHDDFNVNHDYFYFDGYALIHSCDYAEDGPVDTSAIADEVERNPERYTDYFDFDDEDDDD